MHAQVQRGDGQGVHPTPTFEANPVACNSHLLASTGVSSDGRRNGTHLFQQLGNWR